MLSCSESHELSRDKSMSFHSTLCRHISLMVLFVACLMNADLQGVAFAQQLPADALPTEVQDAHEKALKEADKKRVETYKKMMDAAIKKETDPGRRQKLRDLLDQTLLAWVPPPPPPPPADPVQRPGDAALLADLKKIFGPNPNVRVADGVVTLAYDFKVVGARKEIDVRRVIERDFDLPVGLKCLPQGIDIQPLTDVKLKAKFLRLKRVNTQLLHENWEGDWVRIGDAFTARGSFTGGWKAWITDNPAFTVFSVPKAAERQPLRTLELLFKGGGTVQTFDTWNPAGNPNPKDLASGFVLPQPPPGPVRLMGGSAGAVYSTLTVEGELDPAWVQAELARQRR